jgi:5-enolpyruvylshikimate-3-phosphate synthase
LAVAGDLSSACFVAAAHHLKQQQWRPQLPHGVQSKGLDVLHGTGAGATAATGWIVPIAIDRSIVCPVDVGGRGARARAFYSVCFNPKR